MKAVKKAKKIVAAVRHLPTAIEKAFNGGKCNSRELRKRQLIEKARREKMCAAK